MTAQANRDQLRALADAATPGPWEADHAEEDNSSVKEVGRMWVDGLAFAGRPDDAEFIAAARTALPQLLDQLDAAEQRIRDLTQEVRDERGAALDQMEQVRIRDARIQAVRDVLDNPINLADWDDPLVPAETIRRALEGDA